MADIIRWGIIGCGDVCERKSGPPLYTLPQCRLQAVTRRNGAAGRSFAERHGPCAFIPSVDELLARDDIDAVYIASPDELHHEHTLAVAAAGKHVLVEKAMALNAGQCDEMIAACARQRVLLAVAYYRRCYPSILAAVQLLAEGAIGSVRRMWMNDQFPTSHRIDLAHFFLGEAHSLSVSRQALPPDSHADEGLVLETNHANDARCIMNVDWHENHDVEKIVFDGSAGRIVIDDLKAGRMWLLRPGATEARHQAPLPWTHHGLMDQVSKFFLGSAPNPCSGEEGRKSTVILDIIAAAAGDGTKLAVNY